MPFSTPLAHAVRKARFNVAFETAVALILLFGLVSTNISKEDIWGLFAAGTVILILFMQVMNLRNSIKVERMLSAEFRKQQGNSIA